MFGCGPKDPCSTQGGKIKRKVMFDPTKELQIYGYVGSIAHNLYIDPKEPAGTDDKDYMGVFIAPLEYYFGMMGDIKGWESYQKMDEAGNDMTLHELRKFVKLACKGNPSILSFLWNEPEMILYSTEIGESLMDHRMEFSTKKVYYAIKGYAASQIKRMNKGPNACYLSTKRKKLYEKFGYDTKYASHTIRLIRMGIEFLEKGELTVYREKDRQLLIDIKQGKIPFEDIIVMGQDLCNDLDHAFKKCGLPDEPDYTKIHIWLIDLMNSYFQEHLLIEIDNLRNEIQELKHECRTTFSTKKA